MHDTSELNNAADLKFQRKDWILERIFWLFLLLFVIAGLAGFFGKGGISSARKGNPGTVEIKFERFLRFHTPDEIIISVSPKKIIGTKYVKVLLSESFIKSCQLEAVMPEPIKMAKTEKGVELLLESGNITSEFRAIIYFTPEKYGSLKNFVKVNDLDAVNFDQYIYP